MRDPARKVIFFPPWLEALLVVVLFIMAGVEYSHRQWFWMLLFGAGGAGFGVSLILRTIKGDRNGPA